MCQTDLPAFVVQGAENFVQNYRTNQTPDLAGCILAGIEAYIPKPPPVAEAPVSPNKTPEITPSEKRMETRASSSRKRGIQPARTISYVEDGSDG